MYFHSCYPSDLLFAYANIERLMWWKSAPKQINTGWALLVRHRVWMQNFSSPLSAHWLMAGDTLCFLAENRQVYAFPSWSPRTGGLCRHTEASMWNFPNSLDNLVPPPKVIQMPRGLPILWAQITSYFEIFEHFFCQKRTFSFSSHLMTWELESSLISPTNFLLAQQNIRVSAILWNFTEHVSQMTAQLL